MSTTYRCQNCHHVAERDTLPDAQDLHQRIDPGEPWTDKECPHCGALAHPTTTPRTYHLATQGDRLILTTTPHNQRASPPIRLDPHHANQLQRWLDTTLERLVSDAAGQRMRGALRRAGLPPFLR